MSDASEAATFKTLQATARRLGLSLSRTNDDDKPFAIRGWGKNALMNFEDITEVRSELHMYLALDARGRRR
jgi:hypothetical protein